MMLLLFLLALAMMATGIASAIFGFPAANVDRGVTMILAGCTVATGGAVLFGITFVCYRLKRVQREIRRLGDRLIRHSDAMQVAVVGEPTPIAGDGRFVGLPGSETADAEIVTAPPPPPLRAAPPSAPVEEKPREAPVIVGKYASGGNSYVMYSDGSIEADTPSGHHSFRSLDELKAFVAAGGERH